MISARDDSPGPHGKSDGPAQPFEGQRVMPPANRLGRPCALPRARLGR